MFRQKPASWQEQADTFKVEAERLPYSQVREALERKARQLDIAAHIDEGVSSPGLQPPIQWMRVRR
jgi:hypothetical protein